MKKNGNSIQAGGRKRITYYSMFPYLLIAPVLIYVLIFLVFPFFYGIGISLTDKKIGGATNFIGLGNYFQLLKDKKYITSIINTVEYTVVSVFLKVVLGMAMAGVLNSRIKGRRTGEKLGQRAIADSMGSTNNGIHIRLALDVF